MVEVEVGEERVLLMLLLIKKIAMRTMVILWHPRLIDLMTTFFSRQRTQKRWMLKRRMSLRFLLVLEFGLVEVVVVVVAVG
jgi:type II secretory pathway component PulL